MVHELLIGILLQEAQHALLGIADVLLIGLTLFSVTLVLLVCTLFVKARAFSVILGAQSLISLCYGIFLLSAFEKMMLLLPLVLSFIAFIVSLIGMFKGNGIDKRI